MKVSIVIPSYNAERFVAETMESIMAQVHEDYEIILSDGGSSDSTVEVVRSFNPRNLVVISEPDRGVPHALNRGFERATGEALCWLNADDVYLSRRTLSLVSEALSDPNKSVAIGHCMTMDEMGFITNRILAWAPLGAPDRFGSNIFTGSLFFKRSAWMSFGGFSERFRYAFEYELTKHLLDRNKAAVVHEVLAGFRIFGGGLSTRYRQEMGVEKDTIYSDRPVPSRLSRVLGRLAAQSIQGSLLPAVINRYRASDPQVHWRDVLGKT